MAEVLVYDSFDDMGLKEELLKAIRAYGYVKPLPIQQRAIVPLSKGRDLILQATSVHQGNKVRRKVPFSMIHDESLQSTSELGKIATYCIAILNQLEFSATIKCQCLVITSPSGYASEIIEDMQILGEHLPVKVQVEYCADVLVDSPTDAHVVVGDSYEALSLFSERGKFCADDIKMVFIDWGNEFTDYTNELHNIKKIRGLLNLGKNKV